MNANATDVTRRSVGEIEPAETKAILDRVVLRDLVGVHGAGGIALAQLLVIRAALAERGPQPFGCEFAQVIEAAIEERHVRLFIGEVV